MAYTKVNWTSSTPINTTNLNKMDNAIEEADKELNRILNMIYPIGSIYMSVNETDPQDIFGGTWEQIKDTFLLSAGETYEAGSTGGEAEHTLTIDEMPSHSHEFSAFDNWVDSGYRFANGNKASNSTRNTAATGGGQAHNNMPPYLAVYMWKRIA